MILQIIETNTLANVTEKRTDVIEIADFLLAGDKIAASLATAAGQLPVSTAAQTWSTLNAPTADGQTLTANLALGQKMAWGAGGGGGSAALTNKSGGTVYAGSVVVQSTGYDSSFTTTTKVMDIVIGVTGEDINNGNIGSIKLSGAGTVLVQGNVNRGDYLISSATAGRAQATSDPMQAVAIALTAYAGGGAGSVVAMIICDLPNPLSVSVLLKNGDGTDHAEGDIVIWDSTTADTVKKSSSIADRRVCAVAKGAVVAGAYGLYSIYGFGNVKVTGNGSKMKAIRTSATSGRGEQNGGSKQEGFVGFAMADWTGNSLIKAFIQPDNFRCGAASTVLGVAWAKYVDYSYTDGTLAAGSGSNRVILAFVSATSFTDASQIAPQVAGNNMTLVGTAEAWTSGVFQRVSCYKYESPGSGNLTVRTGLCTHTSGYEVAATVFLAIDGYSSLGTFIKSRTSNSSVSANCTDASPGDLVVAFLGTQDYGSQVTYISSLGSGQTEVAGSTYYAYSGGGGTPYIVGYNDANKNFVSTKAASGSTETMSATLANAYENVWCVIPIHPV
jgi:hypothetical protein